MQDSHIKRLKEYVAALEWGNALGGAMLKEGYLMNEYQEDHTICVYCDEVFKYDTPSELDKRLKEHIHKCSEHPLAQALKTIDALTQSLNRKEK